MDDIVKVQIFVTDIKRREEVWKARREAFTGDFPVSTLVEVRALAARDPRRGRGHRHPRRRLSMTSSIATEARRAGPPSPERRSPLDAR